MANHWQIKGDKSLIHEIEVNSIHTIKAGELIQTYLWAIDEPTTIGSVNGFVHAAAKTVCDIPNYEHYIKIANRCFRDFFENGGTISIW